jgi:hypothetical protein
MRAAERRASNVPAAESTLSPKPTAEHEYYWRFLRQLQLLGALPPADMV